MHQSFNTGRDKKPDFAAVILAAGESTRFGRAKLLTQFQGESLIRRACHAAIETGCDPVVVVLGAHAQKIHCELTNLPVTVAVNREWRTGMASSIRTGVKVVMSLRDGNSDVLLMLSDQPLITARDLRKLIAVFQEQNCLIAAAEYHCDHELVRGVPAAFARELFPELLQLRGKSGAKRLISRHAEKATFVWLPPASVDVDTTGDLDVLNGDHLWSALTCQRF